ncbi:MAG: hypothetical protein HOY79_53855 [Streptomyces sp.]|nr:hypothetical protein [Streptomyces sp.]
MHGDRGGLTHPLRRRMRLAARAGAFNNAFDHPAGAAPGATKAVRS